MLKSCRQLREMLGCEQPFRFGYRDRLTYYVGQKMRDRLLSIAIIVALPCVAFGAWWFGPWRVRETLADGATLGGTRYRVFQTYKDFARSGWVVGVYLSDSDGTWKLRWSDRADSPWENASVGETATGLTVTLENGSYAITLSDYDLGMDVPDEPGWSFPSAASRSDMHAGLIHTTY